MRAQLHLTHPSGVAVDVVIDIDDAEALDAAIAAFLALGYQPPAQEWPRSPEGLPICRKHGAPMARREKQGDEWHSHRVQAPDGAERYCRGYAYGRRADDGYWLSGKETHHGESP